MREYLWIVVQTSAISRPRRRSGESDGMEVTRVMIWLITDAVSQWSAGGTSDTGLTEAPSKQESAACLSVFFVTVSLATSLEVDSCIGYDLDSDFLGILTLERVVGFLKRLVKVLPATEDCSVSVGLGGFSVRLTSRLWKMSRKLRLTLIFFEVVSLALVVL